MCLLLHVQTSPLGIAFPSCFFILKQLKYEESPLMSLWLVAWCVPLVHAYVAEVIKNWYWNACMRGCLHITLLCNTWAGLQKFCMCLSFFFQKFWPNRQGWSCACLLLMARPIQKILLPILFHAITSICSLYSLKTKQNNSKNHPLFGTTCSDAKFLLQCNVISGSKS